MDMKGDFSWVAKAGKLDEKIQKRLDETKEKWKETAFPIEFFTLTESLWIQLRSTLTEFGPGLFSRILDLNETQTSIMSLIFRYCDDIWILLLDLEDIKKVLQYLSNEGNAEIEKLYGSIPPWSFQVIMRKILELETQWAEAFFAEPSFEMTDWIRQDQTGHGYINVIRLMDIIDRPKLFSTYMLACLSEIYSTFPEVWDLDTPKLVIVIDEAHFLFENTNQWTIEQIEMILKLIRSKWVSILFCTQNPEDIPESILAQLGLKIQHALRAFTENDRDAINKMVKNFPRTEYYTLSETITSLGIGEALITTLDERGIPTPIVQTMIYPPESRMGSLTVDEVWEIVFVSELAAKYTQEINRESAYEILTKKIEQKLQAEKSTLSGIDAGVGGKIMKSVGTTLASEVGRSLGKSLGGRTGGTIGAQIARGLLGAIFSRK